MLLHLRQSRARGFLSVLVARTRLAAWERLRATSTVCLSHSFAIVHDGQSGVGAPLGEVFGDNPGGAGSGQRFD